MSHRFYWAGVWKPQQNLKKSSTKKKTKHHKNPSKYDKLPSPLTKRTITTNNSSDNFVSLLFSLKMGHDWVTVENTIVGILNTIF